MQILIFLLLSCAFMSPSSADSSEPARRPSKVGALYYFDNNDYHSAGVNAAIGIDSMFKARGSFTRETQDTLSSSTLTLGADAKFLKMWTTRLVLTFGNEYELIKKFGIRLGADFRINDFWNGKKSTIVSTDIESNRFTEATSGATITTLSRSGARTRTRVAPSVESTLHQWSWTVAGDQEVLAWMSVGAFFSKYFYSPSVTQSFSDARFAWSSATGLVSGFVDHSLGVDLDFVPREDWSFSIGWSYSKTELTNDQNRSWDLGLSYEFESGWEPGISWTTTATELAGSGVTSTSSMFGLLVGYNF